MTDPALPARVDPADIVDLAVGLLEVIPVTCPDGLRPAMKPYLGLIRRAVGLHAGNGTLLAAAAYFVRRFDSEEAAEYAERADRLPASSETAIAFGLIRKDQGRTDEAVRAWDLALSLEPGHLNVYADIGELLLDADRLADAAGYAERAWRSTPATSIPELPFWPPDSV